MSRQKEAKVINRIIDAVDLLMEAGLLKLDIIEPIYQALSAEQDEQNEQLLQRAKRKAYIGELAPVN
jgi:hypothetical protein